MSELNYFVETPDRKKSRQLCHVNLLKPYYARSDGLVSPAAVATSVRCSSVALGSAASQEKDLCTPDDLLKGRLKNSESLANLDVMLEHLPESRRSDLLSLIKSSLLCLEMFLLAPILFSTTLMWKRPNR